MNKHITVSFFVFIFFLSGLSAQDGSFSPYSYYKYGDETDMQALTGSITGHLNFYSDSLHYNFVMPSSLSHLQYVNYAVASSFEHYFLTSADGKGKAGEFIVPYITLGIPIGKKAGIGFGYKPYSTSAYLIQKEEENEKSIKTGEGGLNHIFVSGGIKIIKGLHAGVSFNYYFGNKTARFIQYKESVYAITRQTDNAFYRGTGWSLSADYSHDLGKNFYVHTGILYRLATDITSENESVVEISDNSFGFERIVHTVTLRNDTTRLILPSLISFGIGAGQKKKWFVGIEWEQTAWSRYFSDFFQAPFVRYRNARTWKAGGYYLPDYRSHVAYRKRISYHGGVYYKEGELLFENQPVNEFGMGFGLNLPMQHYFSSVQIGAEYVRRGKSGILTTEEKIWKIKIGLSFNDKWFVKRKIY